MSIAESVLLRELDQRVQALTALVEQLAREIDTLKMQQPEPPRSGRPPKVMYGEHR